MVIRSVAAPVSAAAVVVGGTLPSRSSTVRMAMSASADSDMPARSASHAKRAFSAVEGRAVIEGRNDLAERHVMMKAASAANADTPLSCPQTNFFPVHAGPAARVAG